MGLIAEMAVMKLPTVLKLIQRMTEEELVRNAPRLSDQRVTEVSITPRARRALVAIKRAAAEVYTRATKGLPAADIERLNAILGEVETNLIATRNARKRRIVSHDV